MLRRRVHRLTTTILVMLSLLFSQLALARYVCPQEADLAAMAARMQAGQPCDGIDQEQPVLCHQHSADPAQTFEAAKLPAAGQPAIAQVLVLPLTIVARQVLTVPATAGSEARPPPDPLFLATLRLRV